MFCNSCGAEIQPQYGRVPVWQHLWPDRGRPAHRRPRNAAANSGANTRALLRSALCVDQDRRRFGSSPYAHISLTLARLAQQVTRIGIRSYQFGDGIRPAQEEDVGAVASYRRFFSSNLRDRDGRGTACARWPVAVRNSLGSYRRLVLRGASQRSVGVVGVIAFYKQFGL